MINTEEEALVYVQHYTKQMNINKEFQFLKKQMGLSCTGSHFVIYIFSNKDCDTFKVNQSGMVSLWRNR